MRDNSTKSFQRSYNCQAAVDDKAQVVVAADVTQEANDKRQVEPMTQQLQKNIGKLPQEVSADAGYFSEGNINYLAQTGIDGYVASRLWSRSLARSNRPGAFADFC